MANKLIDPILQEEFRIKREAYAEPPYVVPIKAIHITQDFLMRLLVSADYESYLFADPTLGYKSLIGYPVVVHAEGKEDWWFKCVETRVLQSLDKIERTF